MSDKERRKETASSRIEEILQELDVSDKRKGHQYLMEGIQIVYAEPEAIYQFNNKICETIAKNHETTNTAVAKSLENEVKRMWKKSGTKVFKKYFGETIYDSKKPLCASEVTATLAEYLRIQDRPHETSTRASKILIELGMLPSIKGFKYFIEAISMVHEQPNIFYELTCKVKEPIATKNDTTIATVDIRMSFAVERAWNRGKPDIIAKYFGNISSKSRGVPTNGEFIATIAEYLRVQDEQQSTDGQRIADILNELGISSQRKGYKYIKDAVQIARKSPDKSLEFKAEMTIKHNTPYRSIAKNMDPAIQSAWQNLQPETFEKYFSGTDFQREKEPTNTNLILAIAQYLISEDTNRE